MISQKLEAKLDCVLVMENLEFKLENNLILLILLFDLLGGDFFYSPKNGNGDDLLLIAGGVGINPLYSIFQTFLDHQNPESSKSVTLLYSAKTKDEFIFAKEINNICNESENVHVDYFVTQDSKHSENKRISESDLKKVLESKSPLCYICGPTSMIEDMNSTLVKLGVPSEKIFYELWW